MYGIPQQQYLQQQAMQGTRAASQGLPQQQLPGLQHHSRQHQQPAADNNQDEGFDIMDIPSDDGDGAAAPAPVGWPLAPAAQQQQSSSGQQGALHPGLALPQQDQQQFVPTHAQLQQQLAASGRAGVAPQPQQQQAGGTITPSIPTYTPQVTECFILAAVHCSGAFCSFKLMVLLLLERGIV